LGLIAVLSENRRGLIGVGGAGGVLAEHAFCIVCLIIVRGGWILGFSLVAKQTIALCISREKFCDVLYLLRIVFLVNFK